MLSSPAPTHPSPLFDRVVVVGLGLMGGSLVKAMRDRNLAAHIAGVDRGEVVAAALTDGAIDAGRLPDSCQPLLAKADLVILCLPVLGILRFLDDNRPALQCGPVITDVGSTKAEVVRRAEAHGLTRFVGGHPMTGSPESGFENADPDLFADARWFLCPHPDTEEEALLTVQRFVGGLKSRAITMNAQDHDRSVAITSQLPHLLANLLAEVVLDHGVADAAGGSLREALQVAGANHDVWRETLSTNRTAAAAALRDIAFRADALAHVLDQRELDHARLIKLFERGRECKAAAFDSEKSAPVLTPTMRD